MSDEPKHEVEYSIGVDLGRTYPLAATARSGSATMSPPPDPDASGDLAATSQWEQVRILVERIIEREGSGPSVVVLAVAASFTGVDDFAHRLANHLGMLPDRVVVIDEAVAEQLGATLLEGSPADDPAISAAALGAALGGAVPDRDRASTAFFAAGAASAVAGVAGAAALAGDSATAAGALGPAGVPLSASAGTGPAGVPLSTGASVGPAGVPLSTGASVGPAGVPLSTGASVGPAGVPLSAGAGVGPVGVPLVAAGSASKPALTAWIVGAAAVAAVAIGVIVVATRDDAAPAITAAPATATVLTTNPATTADIVAPVVEVTIVDTTVAVAPPATTVIESTAPTSSPGTTSAPAATTEVVGAACTVGAWLGDNDSFGTAFASQAAADGAAIELAEVTGATRLGIDADGTVTVTFEDWVLAANLPGGTPSVVAQGGSETTAVAFAGDGSYAVGATQINSTMTVSMDGTVFSDGPSLQPMLYSSGSYSCEGDRLVMTPSDFPYPMIFTRNG